MSFSQFPAQQQVIQLLQRSLDRGRLGHAYLFTGDQLEELEAVARVLAQTLNCQSPPRRGASGLPLDACGQCLACRKIADENHADVMWIRPESKTRIIKIEQIVPRPNSAARPLTDLIYQKSTEGGFKVGILVAADRLKTEAANAFLKTLEEPPAKCVFILLSTEPERLIETILSRCLRLNFAGGTRALDQASAAWLAEFTRAVAADSKSLLGRYRVLGLLTKRLGVLRAAIEESLTARSPLQQYPDAERDLVERWEDELKAAIEAEYRRQRMDLLLAVEWWLRDVWLQTLNVSPEALTFPQLAEHAQAVARRLKPEEAMDNLAAIERTQRILHSNAQEALVLEVGLLKLRL